jgi:hypothetical protein
MATNEPVSTDRHVLHRKRQAPVQALECGHTHHDEPAELEITDSWEERTTPS